MTDLPRKLDVEGAAELGVIGRVQITVDGVDQYGRATAYDLDAGTVTRYQHDERGKFFVIGDEVAMETVRGDVRVWLDT